MIQNIWKFFQNSPKAIYLQATKCGLQKCGSSKRNGKENQGFNRTYNCSNLVKFPSSDGRGPEKLLNPRALQNGQVKQKILFQGLHDFRFRLVTLSK